MNAFFFLIVLFRKLLLLLGQAAGRKSWWHKLLFQVLQFALTKQDLIYPPITSAPSNNMLKTQNQFFDNKFLSVGPVIKKLFIFLLLFIKIRFIQGQRQSDKGGGVCRNRLPVGKISYATFRNTLYIFFTKISIRLFYWSTLFRIKREWSSKSEKLFLIQCVWDQTTEKFYTKYWTKSLKYSTEIAELSMLMRKNRN